MIVALVRVEDAKKRYYYSFDNLVLEKTTQVVVETLKGIEIAEVIGFLDILEEELTNTVRPIIRIADSLDIETNLSNKRLEKEVVTKTKELVKQEKLDMKILAASYTLDKRKLLIHFEAEERIDFRDLVKSLSDIYHTRIELRQIGPRDGAKIIGSVGHCGYGLCCSSFIDEFDTVSIKMAKNQGISLNTQKISGNCGKLFCCIKYEDDFYSQLKEELPKVGNEIVINENTEKATVIEIELLRRRIKVRLKDGGIVWLDEGEYHTGDE